MYYDYSLSPFSFIGPVLHLLFWLLIISLIVRWVRRRKGPEHWHGMCGGACGGGDNAVKTLRERFAKGEIDKADFEERIKVLEKPYEKK